MRITDMGETNRVTTHIARLLSPRSIAFIGASNTGGYNAEILRNLRRHGYKGKIFPVNPKYETVQGLKCYSTITDIPEDVDVALIIVPRRIVLDVLQQCAEKRVHGVCIISAGFNETDEYGKDLANQLTNFVKQTGIRIIGPNCMGYANIQDGIVLTTLEKLIVPGEVAFVSQSGAFMTALYGLFLDKDVGLRYVVSTGNQADLDVSDFISFCVDDPNIKVIAAYIEGVKDGNHFIEVAEHALERGKPIIVLKVGRTDVGKVAAITHTGSITGSDLVFDAVCKQKGIVRVDDVDELVDTTKIFSILIDRLPRGTNIGVLSQSGGLATLTADLCQTYNLNLPAMSPEVLEKLLAMDHLLTFGILRNPADVRGAGTGPATIAKTIQPMLFDKNFDILVILLARSAVADSDVPTASAIMEISQKTEKPIFVIWVGRKIPDPGIDLDTRPHRIIQMNSIPIFDTPESCLKVIKHLGDYAKFRIRYLKGTGG
jgi:acetyltransferase